MNQNLVISVALYFKKSLKGSLWGHYSQGDGCLKYFQFLQVKWPVLWWWNDLKQEFFSKKLKLLIYRLIIQTLKDEWFQCYLIIWVQLNILMLFLREIYILLFFHVYSIIFPKLQGSFGYVLRGFLVNR